MTDKIQAKINRIHELAKASKGKELSVSKTASQNNDSSLKVIRTPDEAAKFMAQLEGVMLYQRSKDNK